MKKDKGRVSTQWVLDNYNLGDRRRVKEHITYGNDLFSTLNLKVDEVISPEEFAFKLSKVLTSTSVIKLAKSGKIKLGVHETIYETDDEVIQRLKDIEIAKRKAEALTRKDFNEYVRLKEIFEPDVEVVGQPSWEGIEISLSVPAYEIK